MQNQRVKEKHVTNLALPILLKFCYTSYDLYTLGCLIQGGVLINGRGGWEPLKETNKRGGQKFAKNGFLRYLLETSALYMLRTLQVFTKQM